MSNQYCIYLRKSRADRELEALGQGETLARHEKALLSLAKEKKISIGAIYKEIVSGETIAARPMVQQLLQEVEQGIWTGVLVMEVERLARGNTIDQGIMAQAFQISDTKIITPLRTYDPNNEADEEYFEFNLFMSRREYKTINRRIQRGRIASVNEGKFISSTAPFGYDKVKVQNGKGYTLAPNESADTVRLIYDLYVHGLSGQSMGCTRIANYLDSVGISPMVGKKWSKESISDILKNPVYVGKIRFGYRKYVKRIEDGVVKTSRPDPKNPGDYIEVDGIHPAIVDEQTFQAALDIRERNVRTPVNSSNILQNPLAGLIYCKKCGQLMGRLGAKSNRKNSRPSLRCQNRYCRNVSSDLELVESEVIRALGEWLDGYELEWKKSSNQPSLLSSTAASGIKNMKGKIVQLQKQIDNTYCLLEQGVYTIDVFTERQGKLTKELTRCKAALSDLETSTDSFAKKRKAVEEFIPRCRHVLDTYYTLSAPQDRNELLKSVLIKIVYNKDKANRKFEGNIANFDLELFPAIPRF